MFANSPSSFSFAAVLAGRNPPPLEQKAEAADIDDMLKKALETMRVKDAAAFVAELTGVSKKELYQRALELK